MNLAKRSKVDSEAGLLETDVCISVHSVVHTRRADRAVFVSCSPANQWAKLDGQPLVFDPTVLSLDHLRNCGRWKAQPKLEHFFIDGQLQDVFNKCGQEFNGEASEHIKTMLADIAHAGRDGMVGFPTRRDRPWPR